MTAEAIRKLRSGWDDSWWFSDSSLFVCENCLSGSSILLPRSFQNIEKLLTTTDSISAAIDTLRLRSNSPQPVSISERIRLCRECIDALSQVADEWIQSGAKAKQCPGNAAVLAEEMLTGPAVIARQLCLTIQTLRSIEPDTQPRLPGRIRRLSNGQLAVPVFPTSGFFDSLTFSGLNGHIRLRQNVGEGEIHGTKLEQARRGKLSGITGVLGAGNVSSIPVTDSLNRIMFDGRQVLLKMNPVNQHLAGFFEQAFTPLIQAGLLQIVTGGADVGSQLVHHAEITDVHITGSVATHDAIVWGSTHEERKRRRESNQPLLTKPISSELGNVSPWVIVPGKYSLRQLHSQAQHVVASMTNNAGFNCLTTRVVVTWDRWEQRDLFLELVNHYLEATPQRPAYYPGAVDRYRRFAANGASPDDANRLPWAFLTNQSIAERPELFREESFTCVFAETKLEGSSPADFLAKATDFVNEQVFGTLCASVTIPNDFRRENPRDFEQCLQKLRYGTVCVNQWSGLAYGLISPPWGAYPGESLTHLESGIGNVHNIYLLDQIEKSVLEGPLINFPKPVWFADHKNALSVANSLFALYEKPSTIRLLPLFAAALTG